LYVSTRKKITQLACLHGDILQPAFTGQWLARNLHSSKLFGYALTVVEVCLKFFRGRKFLIVAKGPFALHEYKLIKASIHQKCQWVIKRNKRNAETFNFICRI